MWCVSLPFVVLLFFHSTYFNSPWCPKLVILLPLHFLRYLKIFVGFIFHIFPPLKLYPSQIFPSQRIKVFFFPICLLFLFSLAMCYVRVKSGVVISWSLNQLLCNPFFFFFIFINTQTKSTLPSLTNLT